MRPALPMCCNQSAFEGLTALLPIMDQSVSLLPAAVAISMHVLPEASLKDCCDRLEGIARAVTSRVHGSQPQAKLAHLHEYLFEELSFEGNAADYYNPRNNLLPCVLRSRKGLPITLSMVYKLVADRMGLDTWGIGLPGHFIVGVDVRGKTIMVDPFASGRVLSLDEARIRVYQHFGDKVEWSTRLLEPVTPRYWITRVLQNLLVSFSKAGQYADIAAVLEMEILLWPDEPRVQRDLAVVLARLGRQDAASAWLNYYLENNPRDPNSEDLRQLLASLS